MGASQQTHFTEDENEVQRRVELTCPDLNREAGLS